MATKNVTTTDTDRAVVRIAGAWSKTIDALLDTARLLVTYERQSNWVIIKERLQVDGIMGASVISMMLGIGRDARLQQPEIRKRLPPSYNALYLLSKLDDAVIDAKVKEDALTPALTVEDVRSWRSASQALGTVSKPIVAQRLEAIKVTFPATFTQAQRNKLVNAIIKVARDYRGVEVH